MVTARTRALAEGLAAVLFWGASFVATKLAVAEVAPVTVVWLRFAIGVIVLGVAVVARRQFALVPLRDLGRFALLGLIGITLHQWLQSNALVTSRASTSGWIVATIPIFMALLGWLVLGEALGRRGIAGIAIAAAGAALVVSRGNLAMLAAGRLGAPGDLLMLLSAPNWAVFSVLSRRALRSHPATRTMFYVMALGWLFTTVLFLRGGGPGEVARLSARGWASVAFLGVACSGLAYIAWYDALQHLAASSAGALLYLEPLVAMVVAAVVLAEPIGAATAIGGALILLGVWCVDRDARLDDDVRVQAGEE